MNREKIRDIALVAVGAVIITISAIITVPFVVPLTLQSFGVFFVLLVFGGKRGFLSISVYLALGIIGIPVFSGFGAGFGVIIGPTGGYLVGFFVIGVLYWAFERYLKSDTRKLLLLSFGMAIYYSIGSAFFVLWSNAMLSFFDILTACILPFLLPDIAKLLLAFIAYRRIGAMKV